MANDKIVRRADTSSAMAPSGLPAPFQRPDLPSPTEQLADIVMGTNIPDKAPWWVAVLIATLTTAGLTAALAWTWFVAHAAYVLGPLVIVGSAAFVALARGAKRREQRLLAQVDSHTLNEVEKVRAETRHQADNDIQAALELADKAALAEWTPNVVGIHVGAEVTGVVLFAADRVSGKPVVYVECTLQSVAKVTCDVIIESGTCELFSLPVPGKLICSLPMHRKEALFDGALRPGTFSVKRGMTLEISETAVAEIRSLTIPGVTALVKFQVSYRFDGNLYPAPSGSVQQTLSLPPEWASSWQIDGGIATGDR